MGNMISNSLWLVFLLSSVLNGSQVQIVQPVDNGKALVNPQMGWTMHFYSNMIKNYGSKLEPSDTIDDFPGLSVVYLRVPWSFLEPEENKYNWSLLDTPALRWIDKGKQVALRITSSESWMRWATPEWVHDAGAKGYNFSRQGLDENGPFWEPVYDDPVFLEKLEDFVKVLAKRYDRNTNIAFIDIGSFGVWGEGHTWASTRLEYGFETMKKHVDLYCKYFQNTLLAISDDFAGPEAKGAHLPITDYALSKGVTLRDDSICVQPRPKSWFHAEMAGLFWPKMPVVLEHDHYGACKRDSTWEDGSLLLQSVEEYHASYMSIHWWPRILLNENREIIDRINRRMGYRIQLRRAQFPSSVMLNTPFHIETVWANAGVAPCYPGGFVCFTLKDEKGGIVAAFVDESMDLRGLQTASPGKAPLKELRTECTVAMETYGHAVKVKPGSYDLYVSVGKLDGTPVIALPYEQDDGHRRYKIGRIQIQSATDDNDQSQPK